MPMYKKPLIILLCIALVTIASIVYGYTSVDSTDSANSTNLKEDAINLEDTTSSTHSALAKEQDSNDEIGEITVYVSGEVNSPGLITLKSNSRIGDAIKACGDFTPLADKNSINLAQKLEDGMQVKVMAINTDVNSQTTNRNAVSNANSLVNINTATEDELDTLPGIGPAMAKRIIEYRNTNGNFKSIEEIKNVKGIGDAKFTKMQDRITI